MSEVAMTRSTPGGTERRLRPGRGAWATLAAVLVLLWSGGALAQNNAIKVLEEEINLLKETIEANNLQIRRLKERLQKAEADATEQKRLMGELRKQLDRIDVLQKELQQLEAKVSEGGGGGTATRPGKGFDIGLRADIRIRPEFSDNRTDLNDATSDDDSFWGHRVRFGADFGYDSWVKSRVIVQEARTFGTTISNTGEVSIHEAWAELTPPMIPGLRLKGGRAEWSYGSERLIGDGDFSQTGRAFDGVVLGWGQNPWFDIDLFYAKVRESTTGTDDDKDFFGVYASTDAIPYFRLEVYYMGLLDSFTLQQTTGGVSTDHTISNRIHTMGARIVGLFLDSLRIEGEAVFQLGKRTDPSRPTVELDHFATAYFVELSYQAPVLTYPTIGAFFTFASGDANPGDDKSVDFQPLFPTRHSFLGSMDMMTWSNIMDIGGSFSLTPPAGFAFAFDFHYFMLAQKHGRLVGLASNRTPGQDVGRNVGMELDVKLGWAGGDHFHVEAGYSVFIPMTVPEQVGLGTDMAHWTYLQARVTY